MPSYIAQHRPQLLSAGAVRAAWRWIAWVHGHADVTLAPSTSTSSLRQLEEHGIPRLALWGRGVDTSQFHPRLRDTPPVAALRHTLAPDGEVLIGYVGRLAAEKEVHRLAEVATIPHTRLVIVGEGPSREDLGATLAEVVANSGQRPNRPPIFLGFRRGRALAEAYAALDIFVHTGTRETFGQTLQEAAATGLPVVAPARGGPPFIDHGRTGYLFDPDTPGALSACVGHLGSDPRLRAVMGRAGFHAVKDRSWPRLTADLVGFYEQARERHRSLATA